MESMRPEHTPTMHHSSLSVSLCLFIALNSKTEIVEREGVSLGGEGLGEGGAPKEGSGRIYPNSPRHSGKWSSHRFHAEAFAR